MNIQVSVPYRKICARIPLSGSKSESNRVLIIAALTEGQFSIHDLSSAKDTQTLIEILSSLRNVVPQVEQVYDVGPAGTAMRFLTALLSATPGRFILTGSERMKKRPIGILVDALRKIGADIDYMGEPGFPPLRIRGKKLNGATIEMNPGVSSQFISAMLLIGPTLEGGLKINFSSPPVSRPYLNMTMDLMRYFGAEADWVGNSIAINEGAYQPVDFAVEADWSSASYWYEVAALSEDADIFLSGLHRESLQGDSVLPGIYQSFGVQTVFEEDGVHLSKTDGHLLPEVFSYDFESCPDIAQTVACTCAALGVGADLQGLSTLRIKETDRLGALKTELSKFGKKVEIAGNERLIIEPGPFTPYSGAIATYDDHRMAMAFAPLVLVNGPLEIEDRKVVEKSYPGFWSDLSHAGFELV